MVAYNINTKREMWKTLNHVRRIRGKCIKRFKIDYTHITLHDDQIVGVHYKRHIYGSSDSEFGIIAWHAIDGTYEAEDEDELPFEYCIPKGIDFKDNGSNNKPRPEDKKFVIDSLRILYILARRGYWMKQTFKYLKPNDTHYYHQFEDGNVKYTAIGDRIIDFVTNQGAQYDEEASQRLKRIEYKVVGAENSYDYYYASWGLQRSLSSISRAGYQFYGIDSSGRRFNIGLGKVEE